MYANVVKTRDKGKLTAIYIYIYEINYNIHVDDERLFKHCSLYCG